MKIAANIRILARFLKKKKKVFLTLLTRFNTQGRDCAGVKACARVGTCCAGAHTRLRRLCMGAACGGMGCGVLGPAGVWPPACGRCAGRRRHCWGLRSGGNWRLGSVDAPRFAPRIGAPRDAPPMPSRQTPPQCSPQHCCRRPSPRPCSLASRHHVLRYRSPYRRTHAPMQSRRKPVWAPAQQAPPHRASLHPCTVAPWVVKSS